MISQFSATNYILMLLAASCHYGLGRRLVGLSSFFTACLVGVAASALVVAIFANVCAGLIRPYILASLVLGGLYSLRDLRKNLRTCLPATWAREGILITIGLVLFLFNDPEGLFLHQGVEGQTLLAFDGHQSYFSSQSSEMLTASYWGRLRSSGAYPHVWKTYHFFNSSTQAILQGFIPDPGLFTYQMAQTVLAISVLLAFGEFLLPKVSILRVLIYVGWLLTGLSLFPSMSWNLTTTATFSVFAMVLSVFSLLSRRYSDTIVFLFILGISVFRLLPVALISVGVVCLLFLNHGAVREFVIHPLRHRLVAGLFLLFVLYTVVTLFPPAFMPAYLSSSLVLSNGFLEPLAKAAAVHFTGFYCLFLILSLLATAAGIVGLLFLWQQSLRVPQVTRDYLAAVAVTAVVAACVACAVYLQVDVFVPAWLCGLLLYKWIGYLGQVIGVETPFPLPASVGFHHIPPHSVPSYIAIVVVAILSLAALRSLPRLLSSESAKGVLVRNPYVAPTVAILMIASLWLHELLYLNVLFLLYCAAMTYVLLATLLLGHRGGNVEDDVRVYLFFFLLQLSALLLLLAPVLDEIKVPVAYIVLDACLWAICGVLLLRLRLRGHHLAYLVAVLCLGFATGPVHINHFAGLAPTVDITPLTGATFDRSAYVNGRNVATFDYEDPVYNDAFAAILGARLRYSGRSAEIFRNRFVKVIDATR